MMVNWDVFLTSGRCAESCLLLVFEIEIVLMKVHCNNYFICLFYFIGW